MTGKAKAPNNMGQVPWSRHSISLRCHPGGACWKMGLGKKTMAGLAAELCRAVPWAISCLLKLLELRDLEPAKW